MFADTRRIFVSRNVTFDEKLLPAKRALELLEAKKISANISEKATEKDKSICFYWGNYPNFHNFF